jgi:nitronate monooxygenase
MLSPQALHTELQALHAATSAPYNVNFFCHTPPPPDSERQARWHCALAPYYRELGLDPAEIPSGPGRVPFGHDSADVLEAFRPAVVSFHFGLPAPDLLARVKSWGSWVLSSATTVAEAQWLQAHGADAIIAQGLEAGGHRGMFLTEDLSTQMGTMALLPQIVQAVRLPVIAAGGIVNRLMRELGPLSPLAPAFPLATAGVAPLRAAAEAMGQEDFTPLWSGQNASGVRSLSAGEITREWVNAWRNAPRSPQNP